jgi:multidrug efflux system membrane fusion protein
MTQYISKRNAVIASVLLLAAAAGISRMVAIPTQPEAVAAAPTVLVSLPIQREVTGHDTYIGRFEAADTVHVRPRVNGYIDRVAFRDGEVIAKGQLLFVIDPRPYQAEVVQAEGRLADAQSQLALARTEFQRASTLIVTSAISKSVYDQRQQAQQAAEAAVKIAEGNLATARLNLEYTQITAPMAGRLSRHLVSPGNLVQTGTTATLLTTIVSDGPIDFYFDIDEESFLRYSRLTRSGARSSAGGIGGKVSIALPGDERPSLVGTVDFSDNRLDTSTGTLRARARVPNSDGALLPGQFGRIDLVGDAAHVALLVPDSAIRTDATDKVISVVTSDNKVAQRSVVLGGLFGDLREIRSGLKDDERVVISGSQLAQVGAPVVPKDQPLTVSEAQAEGDGK